MRRRAAVLLAIAALGLVAVPGNSGRAASPPVPAAPPGFPHPSRVAVMVLENRSYREVIGSPEAPFLNRLARRSALATQYYAIAHPSLPNYIALTTGATGEVTSNCSGCDTEQPSLVNQLDSRHISWRAYFEDIPKNPAASVTATGRYNKHYNPFVYTDQVTDSTRARSRVVGFGRLRADLAHGRLPRLMWIAPNVRHDGHNHPLRNADAFAARTVPDLLRALGPRGVLYLTWDEGNSHDRAGSGEQPGGGHVVMMAAGGAARKGATTAVRANHYALLRTIEGNFGLPALASAGSTSTPLLGGLLKG
jgi:phosphatidylinositol-3-phosphatase